MSGFKLTVQLAAPVVFNHFSTLDATLCGILFGGNEVDDVSLDMLEYHDGIPVASLPVLDDWTPYNYAMRPNIDRHLSASRSVSERLNRKSTTMKNGGDDSKNECYDIGTIGRYFETSTLTYFLSGDAKRVRSVLNEAGAIGGQTSKGYGTIRVGESVIEPVDGELVGIFDADGALARPVPIGFARDRDMPKAGWVGQMGRCSAPYRPKEAAMRGQALSHIAYPRRWVF